MLIPKQGLKISGRNVDESLSLRAESGNKVRRITNQGL